MSALRGRSFSQASRTNSWIHCTDVSRMERCGVRRMAWRREGPHGGRFKMSCGPRSHSTRRDATHVLGAALRDEDGHHGGELHRGHVDADLPEELVQALPRRLPRLGWEEGSLASPGRTARTDSRHTRVAAYSTTACMTACMAAWHGMARAWRSSLFSSESMKKRPSKNSGSQSSMLISGTSSSTVIHPTSSWRM